ncbi:MAG: HAD hydrolase-like protein [Lachnospiraceae bacterium]|jgi:phosphoglycolate phosphatase-like HAD superfamily hydrolase/membrane protease YdiL (CAAX protease family)|nr:HAD hydrolase-like protein [Lachnospiraceae bacterium]
MKKYLLFDLDGTLTDPKEGICTCVQYALASFGIQEPDLDKLEPFIGPPLKESFMQFYDMNEEQAQAAVEKYRERFRDTGIFENRLYDGIPQMLRTLNSKGMFLAVASSKPTVFVERILEHFGIRSYFKAVVGSELDGTRTEKNEVVEEALRQLFGDAPVEKNKVYMIGDRRFDIEGAKAQGVDSVGVTYGYGGMEELREARADYIVRSVEELQRFLLRGTEDTARGMNFQKIWQFAYPFLMFLIVRSLAVYVVRLLGDVFGGSLAGIPLYVYDETGAPVSYTGNAVAIMQIVGFAAGGAFIWKSAKALIARAAEESKLLHIKREPAKNYVLLAGAALGAMFGLNMLLELTGLTDNSAVYQQVSESQYSVSIWLGLIVYAVAAPLAEELLFRGIIYNSLKGLFKPVAAMLAAAAFFGVYHGNSIQGIYGFLMGCLFIYAYEYFGDFRAAVALHAVVNFFSYLLGNTALGVSAFVSWPVCVLFLALCAVCLFLLNRQKKIF